MKTGSLHSSPRIPRLPNPPEEKVSYIEQDEKYMLGLLKYLIEQYNWLKNKQYILSEDEVKPISSWEVPASWEVPVPLEVPLLLEVLKPAEELIPLEKLETFKKNILEIAEGMLGNTKDFPQFNALNGEVDYFFSAYTPNRKFDLILQICNKFCNKFFPICEGHDNFKDENIPAATTTTTANSFSSGRMSLYTPYVNPTNNMSKSFSTNFLLEASAYKKEFVQTPSHAIPRSISTDNTAQVTLFNQFSINCQKALTKKKENEYKRSYFYKNKNMKNELAKIKLSYAILISNIIKNNPDYKAQLEQLKTKLDENSDLSKIDYVLLLIFSQAIQGYFISPILLYSTRTGILPSSEISDQEMEIKEIKENLYIVAVYNYYNLSPIKQSKLKTTSNKSCEPVTLVIEYSVEIDHDNPEDIYKDIKLLDCKTYKNFISPLELSLKEDVSIQRLDIDEDAKMI